MEVVNSFPTFEDLKLFKKWVDSPADDLLELLQGTDSLLRKCGVVISLHYTFWMVEGIFTHGTRQA